jgi:hypothetical protein
MTDERLEQLRKYYDMAPAQQLVTLAVRLFDRKFLPSEIEAMAWSLRPEPKVEKPLEKGMRRYRIGYRFHGPRARTKARLDYIFHVVNGTRIYEPAPRSLVLEFDAPSHAAAAQYLQEHIDPDDPRPVEGRTKVERFVVKEDTQ